MPLSDIEFDIRLLNLKKATRHNKIPPKILKPSSEATDNILHRLFNEALTKGVFLDNLKLAEVIPVIIKDNTLDKKTTDLSAFYRLYLKFMKNWCKDK